MDLVALKKLSTFRTESGKLTKVKSVLVRPTFLPLIRSLGEFSVIGKPVEKPLPLPAHRSTHKPKDAKTTQGFHGLKSKAPSEKASPSGPSKTKSHRNDASKGPGKPQFKGPKRKKS
jgi:hypothetical protein